MAEGTTRGTTGWRTGQGQISVESMTKRAKQSGRLGPRQRTACQGRARQGKAGTVTGANSARGRAGAEVRTVVGQGQGRTQAGTDTGAGTRLGCTGQV